MKVAFTICSNNYLAKAISLYKSIKETNPNYHFTICLVDKNLNDETYKKFIGDVEIVPFMELNNTAFQSMIHTYSIIELNTAVKPFFAEYLFEKYQEADNVIYFDPDIIIYSSLYELEKLLIENNIVITPHFYTPIKDKIHPFERIVLKVGIYNLGFIAWKRNAESLEMIRWWQTRLKEECSLDFNSGLFVDQIWINYVPLYFEKVFILNDFGYNMAYWNFYERRITEQNGKYFANGEPLVFFHFSGFNPLKPEVLYSGLPYSFESRPDLAKLYHDYANMLIENGYSYFSKLTTHYDKKPVPKKPSLLEKVRFRIKKIVE
jgi:hypothetical protein